VGFLLISGPQFESSSYLDIDSREIDDFVTVGVIVCVLEVAEAANDESGMGPERTDRFAFEVAGADAEPKVHLKCLHFVVESEIDVAFAHF
jgi:hypothetical protein